MDQTVGGTCAMILANVITQRIWAIYARKEDSFVLIAIDWVTRRSMVASVQSLWLHSD